MKKALAALALLLSAVLLVAAPAEARPPAGWSGLRCDNQGSTNSAKVCTQVYVDGQGNVNWVQICATKIYHTAYNGFRQAKDNHFFVYGSNGARLGNSYPADVAATADGNCVNSGTGGVHVGSTASYEVHGTLDLQFYNDAPWDTCGLVYGGAC